jgi:hypothetical protein
MACDASAQEVQKKAAFLSEQANVFMDDVPQTIKDVISTTYNDGTLVFKDMNSLSLSDMTTHIRKNDDHKFIENSVHTSIFDQENEYVFHQQIL